MSIKSIKIKNLLSFDELIINRIEDINCVVGINNSGKSNLLKLIRFFYNKLDGKRELPPTLNSKYSTFGTITIVYDTSRIKRIVKYRGRKNKTDFFKHIYNTLFKNNDSINNILQSIENINKESTFELTLQINVDDSSKWLVDDENVLNIINYLYPFFDIEARHIDLYDWQKLWLIIGRLKSFNVNGIKQDQIIEFFNKHISPNSNAYEEYIGKINEITKTDKYGYREKVLNYVKAGLDGQTFLIGDKSLDTQSDGTNSHRFIEIALESLISLSRRDYINPTIYIDEPETGLHPKKNEELIFRLYETYSKYKKTKDTKEIGRYKTPYPKIIFATHSPNIVKEVIKLFQDKQQIIHFSKDKYSDNTIVQKMKSTYKDARFLNIFSDNEARLFFSNFILFVEGETELEIFGNKNLTNLFPKLKQIDIYKSSSNVFSENINPSYANTSIPYLFLFDADKIYKFKRPNHDKTKREIILENNGDLYRLKDEINDDIKKNYYKYKRSSRINQDNAYAIYKFTNSAYEFDSFTFKLLNEEEYSKFKIYLKSYLLHKKNITLVNTTIEESLISKNSKDMFLKWIQLEHSFDVNKFITNNQDLNLTEEIIVDYIRIFFGGKFEIQVDYSLLTKENDKKKNAKILFEKIKGELSLLAKTSGWATSFLNYAIAEITSEVTSTTIDNAADKVETIRYAFKKNFGELYDIIIAIEKKL